MKLYHGLNGAKSLYFTFSPHRQVPTGNNLLSYDFVHSVKNIGGRFSFSFKETLSNEMTAQLLYPKLQLYDIVEIYEDGVNLSFMGIIDEFSIGATSEALLKTVNASGVSVEAVVERLVISLDTVAMAIFKEAKAIGELNIDFVDKINKSKKVSEVVKNAFDFFKKVATDLKAVSNTGLLSMIDNILEGASLFDFESDEEVDFGITCSLWQAGNVSFVDFLRNIFPSPVYELFGMIKDKKPKLVVRKLPFLASSWKSLPSIKVKGTLMTDYTFTRSANEVHNVFLGYVQGYSIDRDKYIKLQASKNGYKASYNAKSIATYGYRPLTCNFVGFNSKVGKDTDSKKQKELQDKVDERFSKLNESLKSAFDNFDKMTSGSITVLRVDGEQYPRAGGLMDFAGGTFYVTEEAHSWTYGEGVRIQYSVERGAVYDAAGLVASSIKALTLSKIELM